MDSITADILVVGGGAGGTAAAIQAARRGQNNNTSVVLVSELPWLGGMLSAAGVSAPDGNELEAFQTGIWGDFLKELRRRHPEGLDQGWVSFFTYNPAVGAAIFADWVAELPNLQWIAQQRPQAVQRHGNRVTGVQFEDVVVNATVTLDGTELGDLLALGDVPYRWGWETRDVWNEPSAPVSLSDPADPLYEITQRYPVQSPTWVVIMQDFGQNKAPKINLPAEDSTASVDSNSAAIASHNPTEDQFSGAWANYGDTETAAGETCLNYGRLPGDLMMINWPHKGNDYGVGLHRLIESDEARAQYGQEAQRHSLAFAHYIQTQLGDRYGLASNIFPKTAQSPGGALALMPYYRESRRLVGMTTISERDILPVEAGKSGAQVAALPLNQANVVDAIAFGNYANDHHYPGFEMPLAPKSIRWGGRWTGTPFTIPYEALVPETIDGLLVCEKNISVSHIANGATRLQPVVLGIGQAAGMAAALHIEHTCPNKTHQNEAFQKEEHSAKGEELRDLDVRSLQTALLTDPTAPAAVVPLFNLPPTHPQWQSIQAFYLAHPQKYPLSGHHTFSPEALPGDSLGEISEIPFPEKTNNSVRPPKPSDKKQLISIKGTFRTDKAGTYQLHQNTVKNLPKSICLVTIRSEITETFSQLKNNQSVHVLGKWNSSGKWLLCTGLAIV